MVYRDYVLTGSRDTEFLKYSWPAVQEALTYLGEYDKDNDGIPDNDGYPDQTYDTWLVRGDSAYSGSLWLASLRAAEEIAKKLGDEKAATHYHEWFVKGQSSYIGKLWNGKYFRYDTESEYKDNIQSDQLAGQWYGDITGNYRASMYMRPAAIWAMEMTAPPNAETKAAFSHSSTSGVGPK